MFIIDGDAYHNNRNNDNSRVQHFQLKKLLILSIKMPKNYVLYLFETGFWNFNYFIAFERGRA